MTYKLRLIGVGIKKERTKELFSVTNKTTKKEFDRIIGRYKEIGVLLDVRCNQVLLRRRKITVGGQQVINPKHELNIKWMVDITLASLNNLFGSFDNTLLNTALVSLLTTGKATIEVTGYLQPKKAIITDTDAINVLLSTVRKSLPNETRTVDAVEAVRNAISNGEL